MTADDIRALQPGPELDELVCTRLLRWHTGGTYWQDQNNYLVRWMDRLVEVRDFHPSTNMKDALRVWEELERRGHYLDMADLVCYLMAAFTTKDLATAICRIALETLIPKETP